MGSIESKREGERARTTGLRGRRDGSTVLRGGLVLFCLLIAPGAFAEPARGGDLAVPPMDGASIDGTIITEDDVPIDELGNTRLNLHPAAKDAEPLPADLEARLDALSELREEMAAALAEDSAPLVVPALADPAAPPRMDAGSRDPDRLGRAEESAKADRAVAPVAPAPVQDQADQ